MAGPDGVWAPRRRVLTIGIISSITLIALELLSVATALPAVAAELGRSGYGVAISAFAVASILGVLLGGPAADRLGPARPYAVSVAAFLAGLVVAGSATTMLQFIAGRAIQGLGAGAMTPVLFAAIGRGYQEETQLRMFALASTAWVLPGVIGPGLAGLVADQLGWRWVFAGLVPFVAVAGTVTLLAVRHVPGADQPAPAPPTQAVVGFALGAALILAGTGIGRFSLAGALIVGGGVLGALSARGGQLVPPGTMRAAPGSPAVVASRFLLLYGFVAVDAFVPFAVTQIRHRSVLVGSIAVTAGTLTWTAGTWTSERLVKRHWHRGRVLRIGFAVLAAAVAVEITYLAQSVPLAVGFLGSALAGYGTGMAHGLQSALALANAPEGGEGQASSSVSLADTTAFAAGPALTGALVTLADHQHWPLATGLAAGWAVALAAALTGTVVGGRAARAGVPADTQAAAASEA